LVITVAIEHKTEQGLIGKVPRRFYAPEMDALRFLAFMLVFMRHVGSAFGFVTKSKTDLLPSVNIVAAGTRTTSSLLHRINLPELVQTLDFGVCLFFFLSAFLITRLLLIEREATGEVSVVRFYKRRALRIWPLYFFFIGLILALTPYFPVLRVSPARVLAAIFFIGNWAAVIHGWSGMAIQPLWSVSVEEQFYAVWPIFARRGRQVIIAVSAAMMLLAVATLTYLGHHSSHEVTDTWPNTLVQGLFLGAGALTACVSFPEHRWLSIKTRLGLFTTGLLCWIGASAGCHIVRTHSPGSFSLVAGYGLVLAGTVLIFSAIAGWTACVVPAWLLYLGKISYGLYVFHVACLLLSEQVMRASLFFWHGQSLSPYLVETLSTMLGLLLTITCASLTYRFLERPFLKLKDRFSTVPSRPL